MASGCFGPWPRKSCMRDIGLASSASQAVRPYGPRDRVTCRRKEGYLRFSREKDESSRTPQLPSRGVKRSHEIF
jgi:hypothetical protein